MLGERLATLSAPGTARPTFGRRSGMAIWSGRPLRLQYPPDLAHTTQHAATAVAAVRDIEGIDLEYAPESLEVVDRILEDMRSDGAGSDEVAETLWAFGCYVGEVFVHHAGAQWIDTPDNLSGIFGFPIVLR